MKRRSIAAVLALVLVAFWWGSRRLSSQTKADWEWTNQHFGRLLDTLMPMERRGGLYVSYRANRDYVTSTPEYWFMIGLEPSAKGSGLHPYLSAHVRLAQPTSIYDQLMAIHRAEPATQDTTTIQNRIKIKSWDFTEMTCPAIKDQLGKLKNLPARFPDINRGYVIIHPMNHAFFMVGEDGEVRMSWLGEENPLVRWAQETRRALDACKTR
jgi:hypothetical protein